MRGGQYEAKVQQSIGWFSYEDNYTVTVWYQKISNRMSDAAALS